MKVEVTYWDLRDERDSLTASIEAMGSDPYYGRLANDYRRGLLLRLIRRSGEIDGEIQAVNRRRHKPLNTERRPGKIAKYPLPDGRGIIGKSGKELTTGKWVMKELSDALISNGEGPNSYDISRIDECLLALFYNRDETKREILKTARQHARRKYISYSNSFNMVHALDGTIAERYW